MYFLSHVYLQCLASKDPFKVVFSLFRKFFPPSEKTKPNRISLTAVFLLVPPHTIRVNLLCPRCITLSIDGGSHQQPESPGVYAAKQS